MNNSRPLKLMKGKLDKIHLLILMEKKKVTQQERVRVGKQHNQHPMLHVIHIHQKGITQEAIPHHLLMEVLLLNILLLEEAMKELLMECLRRIWGAIPCIRIINRRCTLITLDILHTLCMDTLHQEKVIHLAMDEKRGPALVPMLRLREMERIKMMNQNQVV
jgi:hypothetical protein